MRRGSIAQGMHPLVHDGADSEATAEWMIDLTGDTIVWRHAHEEAAVTVRGPLTGLLLVVYRRRRSLVITLFRGAGGSRG